MEYWYLLICLHFHKNRFYHDNRLIPGPYYQKNRYCKQLILLFLHSSEFVHANAPGLLLYLMLELQQILFFPSQMNFISFMIYFR